MSTVHRLKITLTDVRPPVWRRVLVPSGYTIAEFHAVLLTAMGWAGYHLYAIRIGDTSYEEDDDGEGDAAAPASAGLGDVIGPGDRFVDEYDFGDGWEHGVLVEAVEPAAGRTAPVCLDGRRACPPEDVGGPWGYAEFVEAVRDPKHERHIELQTWHGAPFDAKCLRRGRGQRRARQSQLTVPPVTGDGNRLSQRQANCRHR